MFSEKSYHHKPMFSEKLPSQTHIPRKELPSQTHVLRKELPSQTHVLRKELPSQTHVLRNELPSQTHVLRYELPSQTHVLRKELPSQTHVLRNELPSQTHVLYNVMMMGGGFQGAPTAGRRDGDDVRDDGHPQLPAGDGDGGGDHLSGYSPFLCETAHFALLGGGLTFQQHASLSHGQICQDNCTCCHTEIEVTDRTFYLTQSQYTDTRPTSPSADPVTPGTWQGSH